MRKLTIFVLLLIGATMEATSARECLSTINNFSTSGGTYSFDIWAQRTGTTPILVTISSFYLNYNALALGDPITLSNVNSKYTGVDGDVEDYGPMTVATKTVGDSTYVYVTINFTGNNTGVGAALSTDGERICTVNLTVTDGSALADTRWSPGNSAISQGGFTVTNSFSGEDATPLPIQLASSAANVVRGNDVEVGWKTVSETNNYGFEVYRKRGETGEWTKVGFVEGHGTTLAPQSYSYIDRSLSFGEYFYRIKQIDLDGKSETFPEMAVTVGAGAGKFVLAQNYPNPFNPSTVIEFVVPVSGHTTLRVYNVLGQEVATLFEGNAEAGKVNAARFDASSLPSGLYFYTLRNAAKTETKRMLLVK
jgi:hypothetical protein